MKFKKFSFSPLLCLIGLSVATLVAWGVSHWTRLPFWGAFALVMGAMFINSVIAQYEDDALGGFNNPHPPIEQKPPAKSPDDTE